MNTSWLVVLPPLIVIAMATVTRRVLLSLTVGIISAALIVCNFNGLQAVSLIASRFIEVADLTKFTSWESFWSCYYLFIIAFLFIIGILTTMIQRSGAAYAYGNFIMKHITSAAGAERSSLLLSSLLFIDDYFPCLTIGAVMNSVTDRFKIPRAKLAILVSFVAAPLAIIVPLSTWGAFILTQLRSSGVSTHVTSSTIVNAEPFTLYLYSIPYMLYALIVIASLWYFVSRRLSYGIIAQQENIAQKTGNLFGGKTPITRKFQMTEQQKQASLTDFLFPIILLFVSIIGITLYFGDWIAFGGENTLLDAMNSNIPAAFFVGGLVTIIATCIFFMARSRISLKDAQEIFSEGTRSTVSTALNLLCIWTLSRMLSNDLQTGKYLADIFCGHMHLTVLPVILFILSVTIATLMGTAWGTITMLIPLGLNMLPTMVGLATPLVIGSTPYLYAIIGAIVSGSIVGNHISPIADVMFMTATCSGAYHLDVVKSQMSLSLPTLFSSACAFGLLGLLIDKHSSYISVFIAIIAGAVLNITIFYFLSWLSKKEKSIKT